MLDLIWSNVIGDLDDTPDVSDHARPEIVRCEEYVDYMLYW